MLEAKPISRKLPEFKLIWKLYRQTFPVIERTPTPLLYILRHRKISRFMAFYEDGAFCGFTFLVIHKSVTFICFLAVSETMRSKGSGSKMLNWIANEYPNNTLVLNIEDVDHHFTNYEQRLRRYNFYAKNGFKDSGYYEGSKRIPYDILYRGETFPMDEYLETVSKMSFGLVKLRLHLKKELVHYNSMNDKQTSEVSKK